MNIGDNEEHRRPGDTSVGAGWRWANAWGRERRTFVIVSIIFKKE